MQWRIYEKEARDSIYRPQTNLREGNVFTPACHSVHRGVSLHWAGEGVVKGCGERGVAGGGGGDTPPPPGTQPVTATKAGGNASYWNAFLLRVLMVACWKNICPDIF